MKRVGFLLVLTCLLVTGLFSGLYFFWHRDEMRAGKLATLEQVYGPDGWTADFLAAEPKQQVARVRSAVDPYLALSETTLEKIETLISHILNQVEPYAGIPDPEPGMLTGLEIYHGMLDGSLSVSSDHLSRAYVGVANAAGIPTRLVQSGDRSFAESWVEEAGKWAFVDISSRKAYVVSSEGVPLDAVEFLQAAQQGAEEGLEVAIFQGGGISRTPLSSEQLQVSLASTLCYPRAQHLYGSTLRRKGYELLSPRLLYTLDNALA